MACKWIHTLFERALGHLAPASLTPFVIQDLARRGHPAVARSDGPPHRQLTRCYLDRGGAARFDRPKETFSLEGLRELTFPSEEIDYWLTTLTESPLRTFDRLRRGRSTPNFYKLHGAWHCLVLSVYQKTLLEMMLKDRLAQAEATATAFYAHNQTVGEVVASIPMCLGGTHPTDRFRPRVRGEA